MGADNTFGETNFNPDMANTPKEMNDEYLSGMEGCRGSVVLALWVLAIVVVFYIGLHIGGLIR
jgi:hypothetical protein